ncbi:MAG: hypothetical protein A2X28_08845 [Elusimicrobia bacterium GWA2_56_46]|nr:MAG: hypothetical protein A2X28_08845 [Elusimicrobia bacterium GWA2_56_46]OGR54414.1 MAG: hypothetical protein A2X39_03925 [Elusimicrobia bacterium GWC2_56_31]HBB67425.1 hypothetical protein [Elusimicrobiota bacterium]HBW22610.1 hypothetical protein [Elusimicrobiota bacterium]
MNFFRLRFINTLLVLFIGVALGYLMKERSGVKKGIPYTAKYPSSYAAVPIPPSGAAEDPSVAAEIQTPAAGLRPARPASREREDEDFEMPIKIPPSSGDDSEAADQEEESPLPGGTEYAEPKKEEEAVRGSEDAFFRNPARFAGRDLQMELQMIMARKTAKGWLLNLVRSKGGKNADYLYVEDDSLIGDKPDLKIGYSYIVRFRCQKGDAASGNKLLGLTPTNDKAPWATGISAVE